MSAEYFQKVIVSPVVITGLKLFIVCYCEHVFGVNLAPLVIESCERTPPFPGGEAGMADHLRSSRHCRNATPASAGVERYSTCLHCGEQVAPQTWQSLDAKQPNSAML